MVLNYKKILNVVYAFTLVLAFVGAVQLLYNAIDMRINIVDIRFQPSLELPVLFGTLIAFLVVAVGIVSACVKNKIVRIICLIYSAIAVIAFIVLIIVTANIWERYYVAEWGYWYPDYNYVGGSDPARTYSFSLYSSVQGMLIPQLAYLAILCAISLADFIKSLKEGYSEDHSEDFDTEF